MSPPLCPELRLHLVTESCPLWSAREEDLEALGLPPPFWAFCWAGGEALARYLLDHPERVRGRRVLDLGAGGAVEALAAARAGAHAVIAADLDPMARVCAGLNARSNGLVLETSGRDWLEVEETPADVVLVGDVTYEDELAARVLAWAGRQADRGRLVLLADPGRGCLPEEESAGRGRLVPLATHYPPADNDRGGRSRVPTRVYRVAPRP